MCVREFVECERGAGTVWGLTWLILLVGICGLAVDITNGFRNRTMLQATADSAALASVIDLPDQDSAVTTAVAYAGANQPTSGYGAVLRPEDVEVGIWDENTRQFLASGFPANAVINAVRVNLNQSTWNNNAVPVHLLRIIGLTSWDVRARAVATGFHPKCLRNGLTAAGTVDITSNNIFVNEICIHGQQGVAMQNQNYFEAGVEVTMLDDSDLTIPSMGLFSNPGLPEALGEQNKLPRLVNDLEDIMADFLDLSSGIHPSYIDTSQPVINITNGFDLGKMAPQRVYYTDLH